MKWKGNDIHPEGNTEESAAEEFRRCVPPYKIGWPWLAERAGELGYSNAADDFEVLASAPEPEEAQLSPFFRKLNEKSPLGKELSGVVLCTPADDQVSL